MFKPTGNGQIDHLNTIAMRLAKGANDGFGVLSTGEKCYVALASNRLDLLQSIDYTIAEAIARIGQDWVEYLLLSWQYAGNPANYAETDGAD
ncbi:hypothetical protein [Diaphorobacter sp. J5-51]|uniref:hypothetical protein n=1 Tax=Diaphorobacter sp. J5-51 TaxID=680496 RepID=UPI0012FB0090|nr:hypothetical protein [Diaphorobacter sp. J5-51]